MPSRSRLIVDTSVEERPDAPADVREALGTPGALTADGMRCPACHRGVRRRFCSMCGERAPHRQPRTTWAFLQRGITRLLDADSRLLRSLFFLLFRPGALTDRFLKGHRNHYVGPLKLFAIVNVAFVLFVGASGGPAAFQNPLYYHVTGSYPHQAIAEQWVGNRIDAPDGWALDSALHLEDSLQVDASQEDSLAGSAPPGEALSNGGTDAEDPSRPALDALDRYRDYAEVFNRQADRLAEALVFLFIPVLAGLFWGGAKLAGALPGRRRGLASIVQATHFMTVVLLILVSVLIPILGTGLVSVAVGASEVVSPPAIVLILWFVGLSTLYLTVSLRRVEHASWPRALTQSAIIAVTTFYFQTIYTAILFFIVFVLTR